MKICIGCKLDNQSFSPSRSHKDGLKSRCIPCESILKAEIYQRNKAKYQAKQKAWRESNKEARLDYMKQWRQDNPEKAKASVKVARKRWVQDPKNKIALNLRRRLNRALNGQLKVGSAIKELGCSTEQLRQHLEALFQPGMTWENYGQWHVDHIKPLAKFDLVDADQLKAACHFMNLQPLWALDNQRKSDSFQDLNDH